MVGVDGGMCGVSGVPSCIRVWQAEEEDTLENRNSDTEGQLINEMFS